MFTAKILTHQENNFDNYCVISTCLLCASYLHVQHLPQLQQSAGASSNTK